VVSARSIRVRGVVQGVGFRPFVYRLAHENTLAGWVLNAGDGVEIHLEGDGDRLDAFLEHLRTSPPPAAAIATLDVEPTEATGLTDFVIRPSASPTQPTTRISPDLAICADCLRELFDPTDPRFHYPYINCTNCGPRYSILLGLPYDRAATTMAAWPMDGLCAREYADPLSRRFHAQPVACDACGPHYGLEPPGGDPIPTAARLLGEGRIVAVKGLGGYHLACDARNAAAVARLRERKFRKEKPFAVMARNLSTACALIDITPEIEALLGSPAHPIVLAPSLAVLPGVAPDMDRLGVMLPYTPLHHLLFAAGAPDVLVMTSANRSSEPIAYRDADAFDRLAGIADAFLVGDRPIARRVDDSVIRPGPMMLRRARGYAPGAVATLPTSRPVLALGADLKNTITLVVDGQAFMSQHIGDLEHYEAHKAFEATIDDLLRLYEVRETDLQVVCDAHPQYRSTRPGASTVQHHRAHIASVLAERGAWHERVLGVALDGTGYGDDGTIWGGELFVGSVAQGFDRVAHLRPAELVGGDAAAQYPVQAAAGFVDEGIADGAEPTSDFTAAPFNFPGRYTDAIALRRSRTRTFRTTSAGRLFDVAAALIGFTRPVTFEGQAAMWLEQHARGCMGPVIPYPFPYVARQLDFRPLLDAIVRDRQKSRDPHEIARAFHSGVAQGICDAAVTLAAIHGVDTVVASGGVLQNEILLNDLTMRLAAESLTLWTNQTVPPNDGGISLGQAALATFDQCTTPCTNSRLP
jgi:hydrogenase maturation protein HypF